MDGKAQVSVGGGDCPAWSARGREIVYRGADGRVTSVRFSPGTGGAPVVGRPSALFPDSYGSAAGRMTHVDYDVHPDGRRFVMVGSQEEQAAVELGVVVHWFEALRRSGSPER
jgi:Tol biopolymer transport system component